MLFPLEWSGAISAYPTLLLSGCLVSAISFVAAAVLLHALSLRVLRSARLARLSALLFCITPAGVFMSAVYSER